MFVNEGGTHSASFLVSDTNTQRYGLPVASNNVDAVNSKVSCQGGGGKKRRFTLIKAKSNKKINKRKIKNISNMYKMRGKRHTKRMKKMLRSKRRRGTRRTRVRRQRGGYNQFGSNIPNSPGYTLNTNVPSALASPMPIKSYNDCGDVNHFNNPATNSNANSMFSNLKNLF